MNVVYSFMENMFLDNDDMCEEPKEHKKYDWIAIESTNTVDIIKK